MSVRRTVALALSAALGITGLTAAAPSATAASDAPYDVTIPAPADPAGTPGMVLAAAGTGVQMMRGEESVYPVWQSLKDGRVTHGPGCETDDWFYRGDRVVCVSSPEGGATVHDFASGADFTRPLGFEKWYPVIGADRLLAADSGADGVVLHLLGYGPDAPADLDVPLPGDQLPSVLGHDDTGAVIAYGDRTALVDFATGALTPVPAMPFAAPYPEAVLSADWIVRYEESGAGRAFVVSRTDPGDPGRTVKLPAADDAQGRIGVVGDWIVGQYSDPYSSETPPTLATPIEGGETRDLGVPAHGGVTAGADGALYTLGGTDPAHWGVRRIAPGSDGVPVTSQVLALPPTLPYTALTMANGRVVTETQTDTHTLRGFDVSLSGTGGAAQRWTCDALKALGPNCPSVLASDGTSEGTWWRDTGDGRLVSLENGGRPASGGQPACSDCVVTARVTTPGSAGTTRKVVLAQPGTLQVNTVYEVSGRYVRFRGTTAAGRRSLVADIETGKILRDTAVVGQALQGGRLWTASATDGTVSAVDLRTGATVETHDLGTKCVISTLEAAGRWLSARCGGSQSVTMYDREKKASTTFTVGSTAEARLGDGFVVSSSYSSMGHSLRVTDLRSGARVDRSYDPLASADVHTPLTWAVDHLGGGFAYIDSWRAVHVVGVGGATSRLTALDSDVPTANLKSGPWKPRWWLSKPAASWTLTLKNKATGRTVRTLTGGEARGIVAPSWDGKDAAGRFVANGAYTWALSVKAADGHGVDLAVSGAVSVTGGAAVWRDLAGDDGFGDLLVTDTAGLVSMYRGTGTGAFSARIAGTGTKFPTTAVLVPVGDLNGDRCADVYARVGDQLRAYRPGCGKVVSAASPYTVVGSGWAQYDVLTSPGDVNGDGYADLVARQAATGDVYFVGGTADHRLKARVRTSTNWKLYKKLLGAGDLNGDGRGDLLGVDAFGVLWRYYSTSTGGVTARVKVGPGWGGYSSLVAVGDLSGDGRADLVARDTAGKLWRYSGTGTGAYGARAAIGSGWSGFKALF